MNLKKEIDIVGNLYNFDVVFLNLYCDCSIKYAPYIGFLPNWMSELQKRCDRVKKVGRLSYSEMRHADYHQILTEMVIALADNGLNIVKWFDYNCQSRDDVSSNSRAYRALEWLSKDRNYPLDLKSRDIKRFRAIYSQEFELKRLHLGAVEERLFSGHELSNKDRILINVEDLGYEETPPTPIKYLSMCSYRMSHINCMERCELELGSTFIRDMAEFLSCLSEFDRQVKGDILKLRAKLAIN